ncbi:acetyl-CoA carboxylase biotin carboxyl carrier protein [Calditrichota bacterium]
MNLTEIRKLVKLVENSGIDELEIEEEGSRVRVVKNSIKGGAEQHFITMPGIGGPTSPAPQPGAAPTASATDTLAPVASNLISVDSPMVGTFYSAPSPEAPPYVQVGDHVRPGQVLCIVEAMKLMNEIEAETSGKITKVHCENAVPVEYGAPLFSIEPD